MNKRKFFGTILGIIFWSVCVVFFTFAYYEWKSDNTSIVLGINDLSTRCMPGTDVNVSNIGPVLNYEDGVISEFSIENGMNKEMTIDLRLDIESISDNLLVEAFKYAVVTDTTGGTNYDYANPVIEGNFASFKVGSNVITKALAITPTITQSFQFIVYIDGNIKNDINMQNNSLEADLMIGNCDENATSMDEMTYQAIYSATDNSLTFIYNKSLEVGDIYNNKAVTKVYTGFDTSKYNSASAVPWYTDGNYANITTVTFENEVSPVSTSFWFYGFSNLININLENLDTSNVTKMESMFEKCSSLTNLDLSSLNTSNVRIMARMFFESRGLTRLDLSSLDTRNVTDMRYMFYGCKGLASLDLSNFNTSNVTNMESMFQYCENLINLNLSSFDTSNVTNVNTMFAQCGKLKDINLNNFELNNIRYADYMFYICRELTVEITIKATTNITTYSDFFKYAATSEGAQIIVNYVSTKEELANALINTKSSNSNIIGVCVDCEEETTG